MTSYNSWDEGAYGALKHIAQVSSELQRNDGMFNPIFEHLGLFVRDEGVSESAAVDLMQRAGIGALHVLCDREPFDMDNMHRLLVGKQHDYGHGNILHFGLRGVAVRLCDKIARMENLNRRGGGTVHEALTDTYVDILGYAAIALMLKDGSFELELSQDGK
jgi:hypothetical protein